MRHEQAKELLSEFRDRELAQAETAALSRHLAVCRECRDLLSESEKIARALFPAVYRPTRAETESFVQRVMGRIRSEQPATATIARPDYPWFAPAMALAFAALLLSFIPPGEDAADPAGTLLLQDVSENVFSEWMTEPGAQAPEDPLRTLMEEQ